MSCVEVEGISAFHLYTPHFGGFYFIYLIFCNLPLELLIQKQNM